MMPLQLAEAPSVPDSPTAPRRHLRSFLRETLQVSLLPVKPPLSMFWDTGTSLMHAPANTENPWR